MNSNYLPDVANAIVAQGVFNWPVAPIAGAVSEVPLDLQGPNAGAGIAAVYFVPGASLAASNSVYLTITVSKRTNGGAPVTIAIGSNQVSGANALGAFTAFVPIALKLVPGSVLNPLDVVTMSIAVTGGAAIALASQLVGFQAAA